MSTARRRFLKSAAITAVAAASMSLRDALAERLTASSSDISYDALLPLVASDFDVTENGAKVETLTLVKLWRQSSMKGYRNPTQAMRNSFTLILRSAQPSTLKEGIYTFSHSKMPSFTAFISPISGDKRTYQIVYNRNSA
jgi:hypothetical protein